MPPPPEWTAVLERDVPYYRRLPEVDRRRLQGLIQVFLAEKRFEGCGGLMLTDEMRLTIAAQACILILNREHDFYPLLHSILVYPEAYVTDEVVEEEGGLVSEDDEERSGESWSQGALVLSWDDVALDVADPHDGWNVVFHEFAHQLGDERGSEDGVPILSDPERQNEWAAVLSAEYDTLVRDVDRGRRTFLDEYGADDPAEFFAVITEFFFEKSAQLRIKHPELYEQLRLFYGQDPVTLKGK
jgi:hypothetical protein